MRRRTAAGLVAATLVAGTISLTTGAGAAAARPAPARPATKPAPVDSLPNALAAKRNALREAGLRAVLNGKATPQRRGSSTVVRVGSSAAAKTAATQRAVAPKQSQFVELSRETTDRVFVILAEFGNKRDPKYPDKDTDPATAGPKTFDGPLHNQIPKPDRKTDNSTIWQADYDRTHYQNLYFGRNESLRRYYERASSGRYSVSGTVTDWVKVPYNEARYGRSNGYPCDDVVCSNTWALVADAVNKWVADQRAKGRTDAQIKADLRSFDKWDRYDADADGNFDEPDGYIDHFQIVHAGGDQADGDEQQGEDGIWSHRWYVNTDDVGQTGPAGNLYGGTQIADTGIWVGDYTIQPENGGLGVFAHEYGHDLGLPDLYDIGADPLSSPVEWWSLMSQSRVDAKGDQGVGNRANDFDAWSKLFLGWLDYEVVSPTQRRSLQLGPHEYNSADPQAVVVPLPQKQVSKDLGAPFAGSKQWYSGQGDNRSATMMRKIALNAGATSLRFKTRYNIEDCGPEPCDYAYVEVDDGSGWVAVPGSITKSGEGNGIEGLQKTWRDASFDLSKYAGKTVSLRIRYATDGAAQGADAKLPAGIFVDDVTLTSGGKTVLTDGAEQSPNGWTLSGFTSAAKTTTQKFDNFYIASWRTRTWFDKYLQYGPYNYGFADPDLAERFPYQEGLVVEYWNTQYEDNNVSEHPGEGQILTVDAHPRPLYRLDGQPWRTRVQLYDAPFSLTKAESFTLHYDGKPSYVRGPAANPVFDDTLDYFNTLPAGHGVRVRKSGTTIQVLEQDGTTAKIAIGPKAAG